MLLFNTEDNMNKADFDCIVVGGGPAGTSASIYMARYNRSVIVFDEEKGRYNTEEINQNYLGFPNGIKSRELVKRGKEQAKNFGVIFKKEEVTKIEKKEGNFHVHAGNKQYSAHTIIISTGVSDVYPQFTDIYSYIGKSLFWCITCDGYKTNNKKIMIIGNNNDAACTALQFLNFTDKIVFVTNSDKRDVSDKWINRMKRAHIEYIEARVNNIYGKNGMIQSVSLDNDQEINVDFIFNQQGAIPNTDLAESLGVSVNTHGYILADKEQRTNIERVYAAGDVTRLFSHQIVSAAHEGAAAACSANYDLYAIYQKEDE